MSVKSALRKLSRAFSTKDERAFDDAMEELEEAHEKDESSEEPLEIHNHIPDMREVMRDTAHGELPDKGNSPTANQFDEAPPWFKKHEEATDARFKKMNDSFEEFIKGKKKEGEEGEAEDRRNDSRHRDESEEERREEKEKEEERGEDRRDDEEENLEMDRRRNNDRRDRRNEDEANQEILGELEFEAPPGTGDKLYKGKGKDSRFLEEAFQETVARAEIIAPGIRLPTFDRKAEPARTIRDMIKLRKTAIDLAYSAPATRGVIDSAMSGKTWDSKRSNAAVTRTLFNAVAGAIGSENNFRSTDTRTAVDGRKANDHGGPRIQTLADINKANREANARK